MTHRFAEFITLVIFGFGNHVAALAPKHPASLPPLVKPIPALNTTLPKPMTHLQTVYVPPPTYPVAPAGSYPNGYDFGNCTAYVASRIKVPDWGNANMWAINARNQGITVSNTPLVGTIAQTSSGIFGHVAIVEAVSDGTVTVSEMNVEGLGVVDTQTYPISMFVYIYV